MSDDDSTGAEPAAPRFDRKRVIVGATVVLAVAGVIAGFAYISEQDTPKAVVERYLGAVRDRDVAAALAEVEPGTAPEDDIGLLDEKYLDNEWSFDIVDVDAHPTTGDRQYVNVKLKGFGETETARFEARVLDNTWYLYEPFARVGFAETSLDYVDVNGAHEPQEEFADVSDSTDAHYLAAFPVGYRFYKDLPEGVTAEKDTRVLLPPGDEHTVDPGELAVKGKIREGVQKQLEDLIDECVASTDLSPERESESEGECPFGLPPGYQDGGEDIGFSDDTFVKWKLLEYPTIALEEFTPDTAIEDTILKATVTSPGSVKVTGVDARHRHGAPLAEPLKFECDIEVEGLQFSKIDEAGDLGITDYDSDVNLTGSCPDVKAPTSW